MEERATNDEDHLDPISDTEEDEGICAVVPSQPMVIMPSEVALGKRPRDTVSEGEDDNGSEETSGDGIDLPVVERQMRTSSRVRKRSRLLDGYEVDL